MKRKGALMIFISHLRNLAARKTLAAKQRCSAGLSATIRRPGRRIGVPALLILLSGGLYLTPAQAGAVYQWSVRCPSIKGRRAYLWIPPKCKRVRGLIVACQNMLERPLFANAQFRAATARNDLGLVLIFPGHDKGVNDGNNPDHPKRSYLDIFLNPNYPHGHMNPKAAGKDLQKVLNRLATVSGYPELRNAPLMPVGHSSAGNFVWYLYRWNPGRIFAMLPFKTGPRSDGPLGIPILEVNSEWFDYGNRSDNVAFGKFNLAPRLQVRARGKQSLFGYYVDVGSGHCNVSAQCIPIVAQFMTDAVKMRIPRHAPLSGPVRLKTVNAGKGWLLNAATIGQPGDHAVAYSSWKGNPASAFWYLSRGMAMAVQSQMQAELAKRPQQIGYMHADTLFAHGGMFSIYPHFLADGATFELHAVYIKHLAASNLFPKGFTLGHSTEPIHYAVTSGAIIQVGRNRFRICPHAGPLVPQGNPWQPTVIAYSPGGKQWQPTVHPAHINIHIFNTAGKPQTLLFPAIPNQRTGHLAALTLGATASSGLPVEYFMVSGPARIKGTVLQFTRIPRRATFPMKVIVGAYQWGREIHPRIRSVGPVLRTFYLAGK